MAQGEENCLLHIGITDYTIDGRRARWYRSALKGCLVLSMMCLVIPDIYLIISSFSSLPFQLFVCYQDHRMANLFYFLDYYAPFVVCRGLQSWEQLHLLMVTVEYGRITFFRVNETSMRMTMRCCWHLTKIIMNMVALRGVRSIACHSQ